MPDADRILLVMMLENAVLKKKGQAFEDFFVRAAITLWGQDFEPWKPQGRFGDMKCDGYLVSEKAVFQCYAPEQFIASKVANKIRDDFLGAAEHFGGDMRKWVFVHNQKDGLPTEAGSLILNLRRSHRNVQIVNWTPDHLIQQLMNLSDGELGNLFPTLIKGQRFSEATWKFLEQSVKQNRAAASEIDVDPLNQLNRLGLDDELDDLDENDREVRRRVLGYSRWYDPASKDQVIQKLALIGHDLELVENNAQRLHDANLIQITENHYLPRNEEICQQAAESLMAEFLQELEE